MMLSESLERGGPTGLLLYAIGKNGRVAGTRSSHSTINGTTGDTVDQHHELQSVALHCDAVQPASCISSCLTEIATSIGTSPRRRSLRSPKISPPSSTQTSGLIEITIKSVMEGVHGVRPQLSMFITLTTHPEWKITAIGTLKRQFLGEGLSSHIV
ncbi:hypothetical protein KIN20_035046 [Parelaphostrongylus tenuis]|uniref:Uncharacterized protein n=1 Tax=Parelaphostrongylus tenuis TaxID=148309 RepID=A0AAD5RAX3_PARTN|nr:hypothetical protein KIN20_035046 [Parelaphostrongylus tenuis]